jgi:putative transposase
MNPLRAGLVESPEQYRWSSYRVRAFGQNSDIVDLDPWFENLAPDPEQKRAAYRQFFAIEKCPIWDEIRIKTNKCGILGGEDFEKKIEQLTNKPYISK